MLFNSHTFIFLFLPTALVCFYFLKKNNFNALVWLVICSLFFYGWWKWSYVFLIIGSIAFNYIFGVLLARTVDQEKYSKPMLVTGIALNLGILAYFKYAYFILGHSEGTFAISFHSSSIVPPLAISFFTFQQICYLVETAKGEVYEKKILNYLLFITFFPQLIAGPIVHHKEMMPQFHNKKLYPESINYLSLGITIFVLGLFKKVILADGISKYADSAFGAVQQGATLSFAEAWSGAISFSFQLYFDFSGYSDMAIGLALMFGIVLPLNFNSPYKAVNIIEFWRRWHMTLSRFMRDYVYVPLGGSRKGLPRQGINLMVTMLLGGLWHGAGWTFIFWGGIHGLLLVINNLWLKFRILIGFGCNRSPWWTSWLARIVTFVILTMTWVIFRADNMASAFDILKSMAGLNPYIQEGINKIKIGEDRLLFYFFIIWFMPNTQQFVARAHPCWSKSVKCIHDTWKVFQWQPNHWWATFIAFLAVLSILELTKIQEFVYFQF